MQPPKEQESKVIDTVLKALNDLKSDMGIVKKILNISNGTKAADAVYPNLKEQAGISRQRKTREDEEQIRWSNGQGYKGP